LDKGYKIIKLKILLPGAFICIRHLPFQKLKRRNHFMANPKSKILVSACLYGFCCRYDGKSNLLKDKLFMALKNSGRLIPVCRRTWRTFNTQNSI